MSEDMNKENESTQFKFSKEEIVMPDLAEVWKELYYSTEKAWGEAFKDFVSTETFVNMLDKTLEQYLAYEKTSRESVDKYCEMNPMASKKDIARVAELVVSMEDKLDDMEFQLFDNVRVMADNMLKIVTIQDSFRSGFEGIKSHVAALDERIANLDQRVGSMDNQVIATSAQQSREIVDQLSALHNHQVEESASNWRTVGSQLDSLTRAVEQLAKVDWEKTLKKMDSLEKKVDSLSKEVKVLNKNSNSDSKQLVQGTSPVE